MSSQYLKKLNRLLPLVAIGTVADCQSILEPTNRLLVKAGMQILQKSVHKIEGLDELSKITGFEQKINSGYQFNSQDLGYIFSPILNSSGRVSHARLSIATLLKDSRISNQCSFVEENKELMSCSSGDLASMLFQTNQDRKQMVKDILHEVELESATNVAQGQKVIWLEGEWSKGIVGLLASRLVNQYNIPVVVVSNADE
jgi:single-stranded-DNA-specific exonuclease